MKKTIGQKIYQIGIYFLIIAKTKQKYCKNSFFFLQTTFIRRVTVVTGDPRTANCPNLFVMVREKIEEASSGCILVTCGTFSFICGIIGLFRIWIFTFFVLGLFYEDVPDNTASRLPDRDKYHCFDILHT